MPITIIVKDGKPKGETRTNIDRKLVDAGWGSTFRHEGDREKCDYVERKLKKQLGAEDSHVPLHILNRIGRGK